MAERFTVDTTSAGGAVVLRDHQADSWAQVRPELGCHLVSFGGNVAGREVEAFLQPTDEPNPLAPGNYGAPVLFPWPNRLRGGHAEIEGKTIQIDVSPGHPNAIHGLVRDKPWRIDHSGGASDAALLRCSIESDAAIVRQFPFPFRLTLTFRLAGPRLRVEVEAQNTGHGPMPMGFGWHPYFRLPLLPGTSRGDDVVQVPADHLWKLDASLIPTGEIVSAPPDQDFSRPRPIDGTHLDDVYTGVRQQGDVSACTLRDPATGVTLRTLAGPSFREWVVYAPPHRPTICFEPYTCPTDAFNLAARGENVGLIVLRPGGVWQDWMELELVKGGGRS